MAVYSDWESFCGKLSGSNMPCRTLGSLLENSEGNFVALKHDVENKPKRALALCKIENKYGLCGTYYVQAYLLDDEKNVEIFKQMQAMGAEICYHHDVMDACGGDLEKAMGEFQENIEKFSALGFSTSTVCQHGNPIVERKGYYSNRDLMRSEAAKARFSGISDVMVNYSEKIGDYRYISDAGAKWKVIFDPENNDITPSEDKDEPLFNLDNVLNYVLENGRVIVSTHPHRWYASRFSEFFYTLRFKLVRGVAKLLCKIPFFKKFMAKYYYLAKKI